MRLSELLPLRFCLPCFLLNIARKAELRPALARRGRNRPARVALGARSGYGKSPVVVRTSETGTPRFGSAKVSSVFFIRRTL